MADGSAIQRVYTVLFPFCGVGGGALGFKLAVAELARLGITGRFKILGGIELDPSTARDFEVLSHQQHAATHRQPRTRRALVESNARPARRSVA